ncbi:hypothetical protein, partial [Lysinibacillus sp. NPDC059133]|uniref:hypothetical protein n=1 Tax=Lysinibacillus sp. NPDC059133 TaxID=3346737 RepID=UPI00367F4D5A
YAFAQNETLLLPLRFRAKKICWPETLERSGCFLCESVATATIVLSVRKRSISNKCFICAKAKRQQQQQSAQSERKSTTRYGGESKFIKYTPN